VAPRSLDDASALASGDPGGMLALAASTGPQLRAGFEIGLSTPGLPLAEGLTSVALCGMGGSGVAGDLVRTVHGPRSVLPVLSVKGYVLPEFCGRDTLVVASSFSGNTEETVGAYTEAAARGCRTVAISAGGELAALAEADETARVAVPDDVAMPRAALGYLLGATLGVLDAIGLLRTAAAVEEAAAVADETAARLDPERPIGQNEAKQVAAWLAGRMAVIWGSEGVAEAPALRWRTQINENAKLPAFASALPELDHNEVEGWSEGTGAPFGLVVLRHEGEPPGIAARVPATLESVARAGLDHVEVWAPAKAGPLASAVALIVMGDLASVYLGIARGVDPTPIPVLSGLKERLRAAAPPERGM